MKTGRFCGPKELIMIIGSKSMTRADGQNGTENIYFRPTEMAKSDK